MKKILLTATTICIMSSCAQYKTFKSPNIDIDSIYGQGVITATQDSLIATPAWRDVFVDPLLQKLIAKGIASNTDLQIARLNIDQAEAQLLSSKLAYLPSFALNFEGAISSSSGVTSRTYNLPLITQWELDLFGKLRNSKQQARSAVMQSQQYAQMVQTQLVSSIANTYYTLLMLDQQLKITNQSARNQKESLDVIMAMKEAGMQTETAVNQAEANYYSILTSAKDLEKQIRVTENSMALLINEPPYPIERGEMGHTTIALIDYTKPIALSVLRARPDVMQAEHALSRSFYGVNVARAAFYPSISLGGSVGWTNNLGVILNPGSMLMSAIGSLTQPLFNKGINRANFQIAKSQYEQSMLSFEKSLLVAGNEVNDALANCQNSAAKTEFRQKQVQASQMAAINSGELMKHSSTTYLEVLVAQNSLLQSQLMQTSDWMEAVQGRISLYKAMGGGIN